MNQNGSFLPFFFLKRLVYIFRRDSALIRFNLDNELVDGFLGVVSTAIGFSSASLVSKIINTALDVKSIRGFARFVVELGKLGFETLTLYGVASTMKEDLLDWLSSYNDFAARNNEGKKVLDARKASKSVYISKEVNNA